MRSRKRVETMKSLQGNERGLKAFKKFAEEKTRQKANKEKAMVHNNIASADTGLNALEENRDRRKNKKNTKGIKLATNNGRQPDGRSY